MVMNKVLVTGATGFVGQALVAVLAAAGTPVVAAVRKRSSVFADEVFQVEGIDINADTDWSAALEGVSQVVHLAGVAASPAMQGGAATAIYQQVNVDGTLCLASQAADAGIKRFLFISSIKVNGELSNAGKLFRHDDIPAPEDAYGASKLEAELGLKQIAQGTGMELVIIRPPLVYGPGVKANFRSMMAWTAKGIPLPLGAIRNARSMVALDNLLDLVVTCLSHPAAANQTFLVSDGKDLSTTNLLQKMGVALNRPSRLLPFPAWSLVWAATLLGKKAIAKRLCGNLQIDMTHTCDTLGWAPPVGVDEALKDTAQAFLAEQQTGSDVIRQPRLLRVFDVLFSLLGLTVGLPVLLLLMVLGYFDTGSPLFRQERLGRNQQPFTLVKFRTMKVNTASVASHLADTSAITPLGGFMRKTKLDELPQLWNVLKGEMSLVGPRPGLFNQIELTEARNQQGVFAARPGITGLAQVNNIDMSTPELLAKVDRQMLTSLTLGAYFKYIIMTVTGKGSGDAVGKS